jgi:hypothetical protein
MSALEKFGQFVVGNLRDKALRHHFMLQRGELKARALQELDLTPKSWT